MTASPNLKPHAKADRGRAPRVASAPAAFKTWRAAPDNVSVKAVGRITVDDAARGTVKAIVSVMNIVDRDGDVVLPGAIADGTRVKLSAFDHDVITEGNAPVGTGVVSIQGDNVVMSGQYFMKTTRGRDAFETVKAMGNDCEWSIGYKKTVREAPMTAEWRSKGARRLIAGMDLMESSPVFLGANQYTQTLTTKHAERESIHGEIVETAWFAAASVEDLVERGEMAALVFQASRNGVHFPPSEIEHATKTMRRVADQIELRLAVKNPAEYRDMLAERRAKQEEQEILAEIEAKVRNGLAQTMARGVERHRNLLLGSIEAEAKRRESWMSATSVPLPPRFMRVLRFGMKQLGIPSSQAPRAVLATPAPNTIFGGVPIGCEGVYLADLKEIRVRYNLPEEQLETTLLHELAHHYLALKGSAQTEYFAEATALDLARRWRSGEQHSSEWDA